MAKYEEELKNLFNKDKFSGFEVIKKHQKLSEGINIEVGTLDGTRIGTATDQKLGFYNATPVDRPATISDPSGGGIQDAEARTAVIALIDRLQELGLIA